MVPVNVPGVLGVPVIAPVAGLSTSPGGNCPEPSENVGTGLPVAVNRNETGTPAVRASGNGPLVKIGASLTVSVNDWVASGPTPLWAVRVNV